VAAGGGVVRGTGRYGGTGDEYTTGRDGKRERAAWYDRGCGGEGIGKLRSDFTHADAKAAEQQSDKRNGHDCPSTGATAPVPSLVISIPLREFGDCHGLQVLIRQRGLCCRTHGASCSFGRARLHTAARHNRNIG